MTRPVHPNASAPKSVLLAVACLLIVPTAAAIADTRGAPVAVAVDAAAGVRPLNPLIFGVAFGEADRNAEVGYPLLRWGGNSVTRYNWRVDVHNTAADWYYENIPGATARPSLVLTTTGRTTTGSFPVTGSLVLLPGEHFVTTSFAIADGASVHKQGDGTMSVDGVHAHGATA